MFRRSPDLTGHKLEPVKSSIVRSRFRLKALLRADAKRRCSASWDRESRAVAALRPAGYSSGRGDCARGGRSARRGGSRAGLCSSCAGRAILSECRVFVRAHHAFLSECPVFDHACCLPPVRQTGRLAICCVSIPPWVVIAGSAFSNRQCDYRGWLVHFGLARFLAAIPTENAENEAGGAAFVRFCAGALAL